MLDIRWLLGDTVAFVGKRVTLLCPASVPASVTELWDLVQHASEVDSVVSFIEDLEPAEAFAFVVFACEGSSVSVAMRGDAAVQVEYASGSSTIAGTDSIDRHFFENPVRVSLALTAANRVESMVSLPVVEGVVPAGHLSFFLSEADADKDEVAVVAEAEEASEEASDETPAETEGEVTEEPVTEAGEEAEGSDDGVELPVESVVAAAAADFVEGDPGEPEVMEGGAFAEFVESDEPHGDESAEEEYETEETDGEEASGEELAEEELVEEEYAEGEAEEASEETPAEEGENFDGTEEYDEASAEEGEGADYAEDDEYYEEDAEEPTEEGEPEEAEYVDEAGDAEYAEEGDEAEYAEDEYEDEAHSDEAEVAPVESEEDAEEDGEEYQSSYGRIRMSDGNEYEITDTVVFGRMPALPRESDRQNPQLVVVNSPRALVSRSHCMLRVDDGVVSLVDMHSNNGTFLRAHDDSMTRANPGERVPLEVGSVVDLGDDVSFEVVELY